MLHMKIFSSLSSDKGLLFVTAFVAGSISTTAFYEYNHQCSWSYSDAKESVLGVCFTPGQNCTTLIVKAILDAKTEVFVQAYSFTSAPIADALVKAHNKGVRVSILVDKSQIKEKRSRIRALKNAGIDVWVDAVPGIAHNKVMIIDQQTVLTGSFNWTNAAEHRNAENVLFIKDPQMVRYYRENWLKRWEIAQQNVL
ncbi:MAG: phospholipase D family protein [Caedimonadaceae bacterium]|nr:MAG: phospholipase D family protein [Caedimonadaceae bacterium]